MNILWHSNAPWSPTGYGQQTGVFAPRLRDLGHDVAMSAFWGLSGASLEWDGMAVYPGDEKWGNRTLPLLAQRHGSDCQVITLMDVWVLTSEALADLRLASWVPVDHDPAPPRVIDYFERTHATAIAMSQFGEQKLREHGLDPLYVPHGIDTKTFRPRPKTRGQAREVMGIPGDAFVVGMVAANKGCTPPRKAFPQVFQAFARLRAEHEDAYLYLHTELSGRDGMNLGALAAACGIPLEAIKYTPQPMLELGVEPTNVAHLMAAFDVLANPSYGEGFGIPIVEAQACGTPVIVTDFSSMTELCGAGWMVGGDPWYDPTQGAFYRCPSVDDIADAMREAYAARGDEQLRKRAREFAVQYDADRVTREFWVPALEALNKPRTAAGPGLRNEPWLNDHLPGGGRLALDIGANVGDVARALEQRFDAVHAFEPHPGAAGELRRSTSKRTMVVEAAVGAESRDEITLKTYRHHTHTSAFADDELDTLTRGDATGTIKVPLVALDDLGYPAAMPVDFIKIDVEGLECDALRGAEQTLRAHMPRLLVEIHAAANGDWCREFLADLGYEIEHITHPHDGVPAGHHWLAATVAAREPAGDVLAEA